MAGTGDKLLTAAEIKAVTDTKVNVSDIVNALNDTSANKPLSAAQGKVLNDAIAQTISIIDIPKTSFPNMHSSVNTFYARRIGSILILSFRLDAGIADSAKLFDFPSYITPQSDVILMGPLLTNTGTVFTNGSCWKDKNKTYIQYFGSASTSGALFCQMILPIA